MGKQSNFRVIVVGGGVGGLAAAHAFEKANIDYVVLEKGEVAPARGASIGIYPHGARILDQFGVLKAVEGETFPIERAKNLLPGGALFADSALFKYLREYHGYPIPVLERRLLLELMYKNLPDRSKVKTGNAVVDIIDNEDKVKVILADGSVEEGDLVLGVDGVHSKVRSLMWRNANEEVPGTISANEKRTLYSDYKLLLGHSKSLPEESQSEMIATHHAGKSFLVVGGKHYTSWFVFVKQKRVHWPAFPRYTKEDAEALAAEVMDCPVTETQVFGELWKTADRYELVNIEEGLHKHMFHGRIVLAGDSAHKMTPNIGLGGNACMESVVAFTNLLHAAMEEHPEGRPDKAALQNIFEEFQAERQVRMRQFIEFSRLATKMQAWENWGYMALSRIVPFLPDDTFAKKASALFKGAPKLNFVPVPGGRRQGTVKWDDDAREEAESRKLATKALPISKSQGSRLIRAATPLLTPLMSLFMLLSFFLAVQATKFPTRDQAPAAAEN